MPNTNELQIVPFTDDMKDAGLSTAERTAYAQFDTCRRPCVSPPSGGKSYARMAQDAMEMGIDPEHCLAGIKVSRGEDEHGDEAFITVPCCYGCNCPGFIEALVDSYRPV